MNDNKSKRFPVLAIAVLAAGLLIGGTGGAVAADLIGTNDIKKNAVTSPKIKNGAVKTVDLALRARGAKVTQYVVSGALLDSQNGVNVTLPGTWTAAQLGNSTWTVELVRNSGEVFMVGNSAPAGEGTSDGFYLTVSGGVTTVVVNAPSYGVIDTVRVTRTTRTSVNTNAVVARIAPKLQPRAAR
jgi:hypothetical protein